MTINFVLPELISSKRTIVQKGLEQGIRESWQQNIKIDGVVISVSINPEATIPEFGVGGQITGLHSISIYIDDSRINDERFPKELARTTTHESNHIGRMATGQKIITLADALASEGLAQASEVLAGHEPPFYSQFSSQDQRLAFTQHALAHLNDPMNIGARNSPYELWFMGIKNDPQYPRHGGYKLGYAIVSNYLSVHNLAPSEALHLPAAVMIDFVKDNNLMFDTRPFRPKSISAKQTPSSMPTLAWN